MGVAVNFRMMMGAVLTDLMRRDGRAGVSDGYCHEFVLDLGRVVMVCGHQVWDVFDELAPSTSY